MGVNSKKFEIEQIHQTVWNFNKHRQRKYQNFRFDGLTMMGNPKENSQPVDERLKMLGWDNVTWMEKTVLDIGCNIGCFSHTAIDSGARWVTGIDIDDTVILEARMLNQLYKVFDTRHECLEFHKTDLLSLNSDMYHNTLFLAVLHHCRNGMQALKKIHHITHDVVIMEVQMAFEHPRVRILNETLDYDIPNTYQEGNLGLQHFPTKELLLKSLTQIGFRNVSIIGHGKPDIFGKNTRLVVHASK